MPAGTVDPNVFQNALFKKLDGVHLTSKTDRSDVNRVSHALKQNLKQHGRKCRTSTDGKRPAGTYSTGLENAFKHADSGCFTLMLATSQRVQRSRSEVETHVLIQSHLKAKYNDPTIQNDAVIRLGRPAKKNWFSRLNPFSWRPTVDIAEESKPLLGPRSQAASAHVDPSSHPIDPGPVEQEHPAAGSSAVALLPDDSQCDEVRKENTAFPCNDPVAFGHASHPAPITGAQARMVQFIEDRLQLPPLEFLDAISREDPVVAAYFAVQTAKMLTKVGTTLETVPAFSQSAHPAVLVKGQEHSGAFARAEVRFKNPEKQAESRCNVPVHNVLMLALLDDLKLEMVEQNRATGNGMNLLDNDNAAVLPAGMPANTNDSVEDKDLASSDLTLAERACRLLALLDRGAAIDPADPAGRLAAIAAANPAAAAFCGVADEMLLIKGGGTQAAAGKRFPYVGEYCDATDLPYSEDHEGVRWYDTFLPGVQRTAESGENARVWRILDGDDWIYGQSKNQIVAHVAKEALRQMMLGAPATEDQHVYPLVVHELLAGAVAIPVPRYVRESEAGLHAAAAESGTQAVERREHIANLQKAAAVEKEAREERTQLRYSANSVTNAIQYSFISSALDCEKVTEDSIDLAFTLSSAGNGLAMLRGIQESQLSKTHVKQAISARSSAGGGIDNQCWLRSSWLSMLCSATPETLAERYVEMGDRTDKRITDTAESLNGIASRFKADPAAFLHPDGGGKNWAELSGNAAFMEHGTNAEDLGKANAGKRPRGSSTENNLRKIQFDIAACFRFDNPSMMREVQTAWNRSPASSDLPVALHRAFKVPALIIEAGTQYTNGNGEPDLAGAQIRVVAPTGAELAQFIEEAAINNLPISEKNAVLNGLLSRFENLPIIWLEGEHYDVYLPNSLITQ